MLKKILIVIVAFVLIMITLSSIGPMIGLAISAVVLYFAFKQYQKSSSFWGKALWFVIGIVALFAGIGHLPAVVGVLAAYLLYVLYKKWKQEKNEGTYTTNDPFTNFENQWNELNKF